MDLRVDVVEAGPVVCASWTASGGGSSMVGTDTSDVQDGTIAVHTGFHHAR